MMITLNELLSPEMISNPYPVYEKIRVNGPQRLKDTKIWMFTDYDEISTILRDKNFLKVDYNYKSKEQPEKILKLPFVAIFLKMLMRINPPDHTRIRGLLVKDFTIKSMNRFESRVAKIANDLIDEIIESGEMDIVNDFAYPLTTIVIAEIMGLPMTAVKKLMQKKDFFLNSSEIEEKSLEDCWKLNHDMNVIRKVFVNVCKEKQPCQDGDLISKLLYMRDVEKSISQEEIISNLIFLFFAGHETTKDSIAAAFLTFQRNPEQFELLKNKRHLLPNAIEEILRYEPAIQYVIMYASEDININNITINKDNIVLLFIGAANRDPVKFIDPQTFDISRDIKMNKHITFNMGIHTCLGLHLGRLEIKVALETIMNRIPNIEIKLDNLTWNDSLIVRGLKSLKANWDVKELKTQYSQEGVETASA